MSTAEALLDDTTNRNLDVPEKLMDRLLQFEPAGAPVISVYLDGRVDQHGQRNFLPFIRKQLGDRGRTYEARTPARESFEEDFVRVARYLENGVAPQAQGIAIFACSAKNDFFEVGRFAAPFERNRVFVYDRPHVYPLARLMDAYRRYAVVLADTNRARIFVFATGRAAERPSRDRSGCSCARRRPHCRRIHLRLDDEQTRRR